jgi:hypothetical protein
MIIPYGEIDSLLGSPTEIIPGVANPESVTVAVCQESANGRYLSVGQQASQMKDNAVDV